MAVKKTEDLEKRHQDTANVRIKKDTMTDITAEIRQMMTNREIESVAPRNTNERNVIIVTEVIAAAEVAVVAAAPTTRSVTSMNHIIRVHHTNLNHQIVRISSISTGSFPIFEYG